MPRLLPFSFFLVVFALFAQANPPLEVVSPESLNLNSEAFAPIDGWVRKLIEAENIPGGIVAIGRGDRLVYLQKWGNCQQNPVPRPVEWDTMWDMASCGKVEALAPALAMLVSQGKISYDDPVTKYLPELANHGKEKIKIWHLCTHTSGIRDGYSWEGTPDDIWQRITQLPLKAEPGERFEYSCLGCIILGKVVERVTGETYADFTRNHIFIPLGMTDTMFLPDPERVKRCAVTEFMDGRWIQGVPNDTRARRMKQGTGNGANFSTVSDVAIFASVMLNRGEFTAPDGSKQRLFSPEVYDKMVSFYPTTSGSRGLNWDHRSEKPNRGILQSPQAIGHGGYTGTSIWIDPNFGTFVIVLSNRLNWHGPSQPNIYPTAGKIADRVIDAVRDPHDVVKIREEVKNSVLRPEDADFAFLKGKKVGLITEFDATFEKMREQGIDVTRLSSEGLNQRRFRIQDVRGLDVLVFDCLPTNPGNSGKIAELGRVMQSAADLDLELVVVDHPNPMGMTDVSDDFPAPGAETDANFRRLPASYAMTVGELALLFRSEYRMTTLKLKVVPFEPTELTVPAEPTVVPTLELKSDVEFFRFQRGLYLIYKRVSEE
ncbi:MAG: serine hydrolase [Thermoguttaceae bacterium]|nr:serine hydrolase [Thermoguttaceae bacterium]